MKDIVFHQEKLVVAQCRWHWKYARGTDQACPFGLTAIKAVCKNCRWLDIVDVKAGSRGVEAKMMPVSEMEPTDLSNTEAVIPAAILERFKGASLLEAGGKDYDHSK